MSHSQFHCTGRAYLDMHGLIFETSICYWQDQPGRSACERSLTARGRGGRGGGGGGGGEGETGRRKRKREKRRGEGPGRGQERRRGDWAPKTDGPRRHLTRPTEPRHDTPLSLPFLPSSHPRLSNTPNHHHHHQPTPPARQASGEPSQDKPGRSEHGSGEGRGTTTCGGSPRERRFPLKDHHRRGARARERRAGERNREAGWAVTGKGHPVGTRRHAASSRRETDTPPDATHRAY